MRIRIERFLKVLARYRKTANLLFFWTLILGYGAFILISKIPTFVKEFPDWRDVILKVALPIATVLVAVASVIFLYLTPWRKLRTDDRETHSDDANRSQFVLNALNLASQKIDSASVDQQLARFEQAQRDLKEEISNPVRAIDDHFKAQSSRLSEEIDSLGKRANINLFIGVITTILGLSVLSIVAFQDLVWLNENKRPTSPVSSSPLQPPNLGDARTVASAPKDYPPPQANNRHAEDPDWASLVYHYLPKLSLVIFIELFAFFFLKLYKSNLSEIKYFQNEITNTEIKAIALRAVLARGTPEDVGLIIKALIQTERNVVLQKDQTTVELEKAKLEMSSYKDAFGRLVDVVGKK